MERREEDYKRLIYEEEEREKVMKNVLENCIRQREKVCWGGRVGRGGGEGSKGNEQEISKRRESVGTLARREGRGAGTGKGERERMKMEMEMNRKRRKEKKEEKRNRRRVSVDK